jgi:type I restriction enzyme S subunit
MPASVLRQTILNLAIRGRLVSQDAGDEPASRLLGPRQVNLNSQTEPWRLPSGWAWSSFHLIGETLGGVTPSKADPGFWAGSIPWVSPKDMKFDVIHDAQDHISELALEHSAARLIPEGSLLMVVRGMILAHSFPTALTATPLAINQDMKAIVPFRADLGRFLLPLTKGLKPEVLRLVLRCTHGTCKLLTVVSSDSRRRLLRQKVLAGTNRLCLPRE